VRRSLLNQASLNLAAGVVASIGALGLSIIVSRTLGPSDTGRYSFATYVMLTAVTAATLGAPLAALRWTASFQERPSDLAAFARTTRRLGLLVGVTVGLTLAASAFLGVTIGNSSAALAVVGFGAACGVSFAFSSAVIAGLARYRTLVKLNAVVSLVQLSAAGVAAAMDAGFVVFVGIVVGGSALQAVIGRWVARRATGPAPVGLDASARREFRTDAVELSAISLLDAVVFQRVELFLLAAYAADSEVALYALASVLANRLIGFLPSALNGVLLQRFASTDDLQGQITLAMRWVALAALPVSAAVIATADSLSRLLFGDEFADMAPVVRAVAAFGGVSVLSVAASSAIYAERRQRQILPRIAFCAVLNVGAALLLIPPLGALGAALAAGASQSVATALGFRLVQRELGLRLPLAEVAIVALVAAGAAGAGLLVTSAVGTGFLAVIVGSGTTALLAAVALLVSPAVTPEERSLLHGRLQALSGR